MVPEKALVALEKSKTTTNGNGTLATFSSKDGKMVGLGATDNGAFLEISNKTGEGIIQVSADEYGNGVVGAFNRKGKGLTLQPRP